MNEEMEMSKIADYMIDIANRFENGESVESISKSTGFSYDEVWAAIDEVYSYDEGHEESVEEDEYDDSMDGDHASALASAGWGTDEDYGYYGDEWDQCDY